MAARLLQAVAAACGAGVVLLREGWRRRGRDGWLGALGAALVHASNRLGATFIKVGQIASTRADLLPPALIAELATLRDRVPPFPYSQVQDTIEASLGQPLGALFTSFDREPVAAASVAQVHRAVLRESGETVAVKVRRPDLLEKVALDRSILRFASRNLERWVPTLRLVALEAAVGEFCDAVETQIHLDREADHNRRFRANFADDPDVHFPRLVPALCSDSVLTMEFVEAIQESELEASGVDVARVVEAGMRCVCRMVFRDGFVHADLHPGNLRFTQANGVVLLDLGLVGEMAEADRISTAQVLFAFATGDGRTVARLFHEHAPHAATPDYERYEREVCEFVERLRHRGLGNVELTIEIGRLLDVLRRHRIQAKSHMTMVNIALATAEGLGKRLAPELNLAQQALPYLAEAIGVPPPAPAAAGDR